MVRFHNISGFAFDRWMFQNKGVVCDVCDGKNIDSVLVRTSRGVAALFETFSPGLALPRLTLVFAAAADPVGVETVNNMWSAFAGADVVAVGGAV
jgi:hypothetical protein